MIIKKLFCLFLCVLMLPTALLSCKKQNDEPKVQATSYYEFFDTVSVILSYEEDAKEIYDANCQAVSELLGEYHKLFDIYYEYSGINNLRTVNLNAGKQAVKVDRRIIDLLLFSKKMYELTGGRVNVAMGSVLSLWHEARERGADEPESAAIPSKDALYEAALHTDVNSIVIDEESSTVYISDPKARIDVGAVAKGYATERAAELLISRGVRSYVLNVGGNIRTIGEKSEGKGWITGITNPDKSSKDSFSCKVSLSDTSLVTSGDYERFFIYGGEKYHHIIDPETNMPARYFSSVSIITKDSALADALSTALFSMSYEDGKRLAESIGDVGVIWIYSDGSLKKSDNVELVS